MLKREIAVLTMVALLLITCGTPTPTEVLFRSDLYHLAVALPPGWVAAEGPEWLASPFTGLVAFNNWGEASFWAPAVTQGDSTNYSPQSTLAQVPAGGAYIALVHLSGGPPRQTDDYGPEYDRQDLSELWEPHDCRQGSGSTWVDFSKWGRSLRLEVYCQPGASDAAVTEVNNLLASWRFDRVPAGDPGWSTSLARSSLPPAAQPVKFPLLSGWSADDGPLQSSSADGSATRITQAEVQDQTVVVTFTIRWGDPSTGWSGDECPAERCHWWRFEVRPDGQLVHLEEGGAALLAFSMEGEWLRHSDPVLGFAAQVPGDWQVTAPEQQLDALGRLWTAVEFVSPAYALGYPPLDQYHFRVAMAESMGGTLTETVEFGLSMLSPDFRDQIEMQCCLTVGGEPAMELLNYPPTRWGSRQLVILHEVREYRLTFYPQMGISANSEAGMAARQVVETFLRTFTFLPVTITPVPPLPTITPVPTPTSPP